MLSTRKNSKVPIHVYWQNLEKIEGIKNRLYPAMDNDDMEAIKNPQLKILGIVCPIIRFQKLDRSSSV